MIILLSLMATFIGIGLMIVQKRDGDIPLPFGLYLAGANWITLLWGEDLLNQRLCSWLLATCKLPVMPPLHRVAPMGPQ